MTMYCESVPGEAFLDSTPSVVVLEKLFRLRDASAPAVYAPGRVLMAC
jgi:hypothetical protein